MSAMFRSFSAFYYRVWFIHAPMFDTRAPMNQTR